MLERTNRREIAGQVPWFGTDEKTSGELDFYVRSRLGHKNYGLEIKRGNEIAVIANGLLEKGKLDFVYNFKNTYSGGRGRMYAVPLYLAGRGVFDLGKTVIPKRYFKLLYVDWKAQNDKGKEFFK